MTKRFVGLMAAASALALLAGQADAAIYNLTLTGTVSEGHYSQQDFGGTHYDQWFLSLHGLDAMNAFTVQQGDVINTTVTLDQQFTIPQSVNLTSFVFFLFGNQFPQENTGTNMISTSFFLNGVPGPAVADGGATTTSGQIAAGVVFFPPNNGAITFDSLTSSFTINDLLLDAVVDRAGISYTLFSNSAVPEPASWALMLLGFGGLGAALRNRRRLLAA